MTFLKFFIAAAIGFCGGVYFGFYMAPHEYLLWNSQYKASILAFELRQLQNGNINTIIDSKEISLNGELGLHAEYLESKLNWLLPFRQPFDRKHIQNAVDYRLTNPYTMPDMSKPSSWKEGVNMEDPFIQEVIEGHKILNEQVEQVLELYGDTSP